MGLIANTDYDDMDFVQIARDCKLVASDKETAAAINRLKRLKGRAKAAVAMLSYSRVDHSPESDLIFAVIGQAVEDLAVKDKIVSDSARYYFMHKDYEIHAHLSGLEPGYVARTLVQMKLLKRMPYELEPIATGRQ